MQDSTLVLPSDQTKITALSPLTAPAENAIPLIEFCLNNNTLPVFDEPVWFFLKETIFCAISYNEDCMIQ